MSTGPQAHLKSINVHNMLIAWMEQHEDLISDHHTGIWQPSLYSSYEETWWLQEQLTSTQWTAVVTQSSISKVMGPDA